jgi:hypothetical protein
MVFATIKKAYFVVTTVMTSVVMIGGFAIIIKNSNDTSIDWAKELIMICLALWVPSPVDFMENTLQEARRGLLGANNEMYNKNSQSTSSDTFETCSKQVDTLTKKAVDAVIQNINHQHHLSSDTLTESNTKWDIENQLIYTRQNESDKQVNSNIEQIHNDSQIDVVVEVV